MIPGVEEEAQFAETLEVLLLQGTHEIVVVHREHLDLLEAALLYILDSEATKSQHAESRVQFELDRAEGGRLLLPVINQLKRRKPMEEASVDDGSVIERFVAEVAAYQQFELLYRESQLLAEDLEVVEASGVDSEATEVMDGREDGLLDNRSEPYFQRLH